MPLLKPEELLYHTGFRFLHMKEVCASVCCFVGVEHCASCVNFKY